MCVDSLLPLPCTDICHGVRGHLDKPGPLHVKTFNLLSSAKKKKNAFCKQYNIYGLKGLRLDILEGDIILLAAD